MVRGPVSTIYGANAYTGVIQLVSYRGFGTVPQGAVRAEVGIDTAGHPVTDLAGVYSRAGERVLARGPELDVTGELDGVPFETPIELTDALRNHPDLPTCLTRSVYRYATGHEELRSEAAQLVALGESFADSGYRVKELLVQVALSEGFRRASGLRTVAEETN